jgi:hypothetical protein
LREEGKHLCIPNYVDSGWWQLTDNVREISETTLEHFVNGILRTVRDLWPSKTMEKTKQQTMGKFM